MKRHSGFAIIELPIVIFILGLILLGLTLAIYLSVGKLVWFFLIVGGLLLALAIAMFISFGFGPNRNK